MQRNHWTWTLGWGFTLSLAVLAGWLAWDGGMRAIAQPAPFEFAAIGDIQYNSREEAVFPKLLDAINRSQVRFTIHDGDIKSGGTPCTDELLLQRQREFNQFRQPLIYTFGDNEWTDCHRPAAGGFDSLERLAKLRELFTRGDRSLGQRPLRLRRQSVDLQYRKFRENVMWESGQIVFAGLHVVGSNNNLGRNPVNDAEYFERNVANLAWLKAAFERAKASQSLGLVLFMQANPEFEKPAEQRMGFNDFIAALRAEVMAYGKPVLLIHGDSHYFRLDKPLNDEQGFLLTNFTRLESFATPNMHWVRVRVEPKNPNLFEVFQEFV